MNQTGTEANSFSLPTNKLVFVFETLQASSLSLATKRKREQKKCKNETKAACSFIASKHCHGPFAVIGRNKYYFIVESFVSVLNLEAAATLTGVDKGLINNALTILRKLGEQGMSNTISILGSERSV